MNTKEKKDFIENLCISIASELTSKVEKMPENWDGFELRELLAEKFRSEAYLLQKNKTRFKDYKNDVLILNL